MNCSEIHKLMDDYLDDLIPQKQRMEFEDSIENCPEEKALLAKYKLLQKRLTEMPLSFMPTSDVLDNLKDSLLEDRSQDGSESSQPSDLEQVDKKTSKVDKGSKPSTSKIKKKLKKKSKLVATLASAVGAIIIIVIAVYYYFNIYSNTSPWKFNLLNGSSTINGVVSEEADIYSGDKINLNDIGIAKITLPALFDLELFENTTINILTTKRGANEIEVIDGSFEFKSLSEESNFSIIHNGIKIHENSGRFNYKKNLEKDIEINVSSGTVEIEYLNQSFRVASDHLVTIVDEKFFTIPVHKDASIKFKRNIDRLSKNLHDIAALSTAMVEAKQTDLLSLLRLLELVSPSKKELLYQKITNMFSAPPGVTKEGILNGNKRMLEKWWSEVEAQI